MAGAVGAALRAVAAGRVAGGDAGAVHAGEAGAAIGLAGDLGGLDGDGRVHRARGLELGRLRGGLRGLGALLGAGEEAAVQGVAADAGDHRPLEQVDGHVVAAAEDGLAHDVPVGIPEVAHHGTALDRAEVAAGGRGLALVDGDLGDRPRELRHQRRHRRGAEAKEFAHRVFGAGERRTYNANAIFRDPAWRKQDKEGALRIHPSDADSLGLADGTKARVRSATGVIDVSVKRDESVRRGMVTLPHGHGTRYGDSEPIGPALNQLTSAEHCEPFTRTPFHKHVPVRIRPSA